MPEPTRAYGLFVGQVADPGSEDWTTVVADADQRYVAHCLAWQGYAGLRHRITASGDS